jgi:hypothetical protein
LTLLSQCVTLILPHQLKVLTPSQVDALYRANGNPADITPFPDPVLKWKAFRSDEVHSGGAVVETPSTLPPMATVLPSECTMYDAQFLRVQNFVGQGCYWIQQLLALMPLW